MATYSNLLSLEYTINQILDHDRFSISPHEKEHIISLQKCVISLQAFLEDFPEKAKILETRIRDVADDAEDIIQLFLEDQIKCGCIYTERISTPTAIMFNFQLHKVRERMDSIANEAVKIKNSIIVEGVQVGDYVGANSSSSSSQTVEAGKMEVVGLNEDLKEIREKLCGWAPQLQILPISGMGGIGKTTLARNAYNDQVIVEHFQIRAWITISQDYSAPRIISELLNSMKEFDPNWKQEDMEEIDKLRVKVHKILTSRRFLIVIDDIWSTKVMDDMKHLFPNNNNRSRIMLTTRLIEVARYANSSILPHEMRLMDADQGWNLLRQKVNYVPPELESIGREIVRSCGGLPLAIVVIAGHLSTVSKTITSWEEVARNIRSSLDATHGQIEKILSLSYNHLPHHLRPCFLYMGGFSEDYEIKVTDLIRLWIAENFVKLVVSEAVEDTAEVYLNDLVNRSLVVVSGRKSNGKIKYCRLHDMVREMCIKLSKEEKFLMQVIGWEELNMKDQWRVSVCRFDVDSFPSGHNSTIRTLMYFGYLYLDDNSPIRFTNFRFLKVLFLQRCRIESCYFSYGLESLFYLRHLTLQDIWSIPSAISNLESLQTLSIMIVIDKYLTYEIWNMQQLRHLSVDGQLADINAGTSALENLQSLAVRNLTCSISTLSLIPNLTKLRLTYTWESGELLLHNFVHLRRLEKLHLEQLRCGWHCPWKANLVVPSSLKILTLIGWGQREPFLKIVGPFPNLEVLKLRDFEFMGGVWGTSDNDFPQLRFLLIERSNLKQWETTSSHFPRLKALHILECWDLSEIPDCIGEIPTLELIELKLCREPLANSAKWIQEEARSYNDDVFQVRSIDCWSMEELSHKSSVRLEI